ncbi:type II toxin-antitoxin system RelE/ParE family toxin [Flaviflexus salsibiostraticola]|uniref:Type II toxin-antitoxin system RelE/ParE family toxin n=1 Tax=Flaviflexus salsibiostraticola TaxID=1282737 RepID=A0A3Q8WSI1_9ACTO|nr:type II toxin-antitoxin system RelE/ParE family toxin [Flaviflexus salsibiostraticola]AZN29212.1 type II toxin-antitoxin system RelE/ParE family toxin [Flaviflexus salsibiostraticola]
MYDIRIAPKAAKAFKRLHPQDMRRLKQAIEELAGEPRPTGTIEVKGSGGALRIRVGNYRVIYEVKDAELVVLVISIGHRREIYR